MNSTSKNRITGLKGKAVRISYVNSNNHVNTIHGIIQASTNDFFVITDFFSTEYPIKRTNVIDISIIRNHSKPKH